MEKIDTFKITVLGWDKHNSKKKKGHQYIMLSTRFFDDLKISKLTSSEREVYLWLLLRCGDEASKSVVSCTQDVRKNTASRRLDVTKVLKRLQSLQLVSIDEFTPLIKRHYKTLQDITLSSGHLKKRPEEKPKIEKRETTPPALETAGGKSGKVWSSYSKTYLDRYKTDPVRNKKINSQLCQLVDRLGEVEAPEVAAFYLTHNDFLYVKSRHSVDFLVRDAEKLRTEWVTGIKSTKHSATAAETKDFYQEQMSDIKQMFRERET